jgi:mRNA-degrading endonuclease RelE of RelBE toxin-antitoxin system
VSAPLSQKFRVAIYEEFLESFAKLPRAQQKKVHQFMRKFRSDPTSSAINYEKISTFRDPNMRTVRIDQQYRAVLLKPDQGNVYVMLWVDNHDEAMAWAENKQVVIPPGDGVAPGSRRSAARSSCVAGAVQQDPAGRATAVRAVA